MSGFDQYRVHFERMQNRVPAGDELPLSARWLPTNRDASILDVGCGWGHTLMRLMTAGYRVLTGIDVSPGQIALARAALPAEISLVCSDAVEFLEKHSGEYDLITLFDVIEHMSPQQGEKLLRTMAHALKEAGLVVIRTPNMANLLGTYTRHIDMTHVTGYTEWSLAQLLEAAGFAECCVVREESDTRFWRWYAPWRGFALRARLIAVLHRLIFALFAMRPAPSATGFNLTMTARKVRSEDSMS